MTRVEVQSTSLPGVVLVCRPVYPDSRGSFQETWNGAKDGAQGLPSSYVQDNLSRSLRGVLRGLHVQIARPQGKLVSALRGEIWDVAVDLRRGSATFGKWSGTVLSGGSGKQLYIPPGFAHGFCVTSDEAWVHYKCTAPWDPASERTLLWEDPVLGIPWPLQGMRPVVSDKDARGLPLAEFGQGVPV